jgi:methionyl-tRNA formyltransferase
VQVAFLGTSEYAASVLRRLGGSPHELTLAMTPPDRPRGRGRRLSSPPAAEVARELGVELLQTGSVNDPEAFERLRAAEPDVAVVCAFGQLIREPLLSELELLNVHPSLLPRWRGAAPIERAIMAGDELTGVSIMRLTEGLDSGPVCLAEAEPIHPDDSYGTLAKRLEQRGAALLVRALEEHPPLREQSEEGVTYAERITADDRTLDPDAPPEVNERVVRALHPHIGARVQLDDGSWLGVRRARVGDGPLSWHGLELLEVQPPGGRPMDAAAYVRGHGAG